MNGNLHAPSRILAVDEVAPDLAGLAAVLGGRCTIVTAGSGERLLELAQRAPLPELVLLDVKTAGPGGFPVLSRLKSEPATASIPVILIAASHDAGDEARSLALGVADYVARPFTPPLLHHRIATQLELQRHRHDFWRLETRVAGLAARRDPVTGLPDRSLFFERLAYALQSAGVAQAGVSLLIVNLDNFRAINESLGHGAGDRVLFEAGERLRALLPQVEAIARTGADEFDVIVGHGPAMPPIDDIARSIVDALSRPFILEGRPVFVGACVGIATFPEDGADAETLFTHAEAALRQAKAHGRGVFHFFSPRPGGVARDRLSLETDLRLAVERGELQVHYQPQSDLVSGRVVGVEALARWNHPVHGAVSPADFIPLAEESGCIVALGEWVLHAACRQFREWIDAGHLLKRVAVNVSTKQLGRGRFVDTVRSALDASGIAPEQLELEITESCLMCDPAASFDEIAALKALGVRLST